MRIVVFLGGTKNLLNGRMQNNHLYAISQNRIAKFPHCRCNNAISQRKQSHGLHGVLSHAFTSSIKTSLFQLEAFT